MTVVPLAQARGIVADVTPIPLPAGWWDPRPNTQRTPRRVFTMSPSRCSMRWPTQSGQRLRQDTNDIGARTAAEALRDARIALDIAITAAGRALADREVPLRTL